jgi:phage baseplate assembly protein V
MSEILRTVEKHASRLADRVKLMVGRGKVGRVDDANPLQTVQLGLFAGETREAVQRVQNYGFTSHPIAGEAVMLAIGGNRDHPIAVVVDDPDHRLTGLEAGEVAVYHHDHQAVILLKAGGVIEIKAAEKILVDTPRMEVTGDLIDRTGSGNPHTVREMREIYNRHVHPEDDQGNTEQPTEAQ